MHAAWLGRGGVTAERWRAHVLIPSLLGKYDASARYCPQGIRGPLEGGLKGSGMSS